MVDIQFGGVATQLERWWEVVLERFGGAELNFSSGVTC